MTKALPSGLLLASLSFAMSRAADKPADDNTRAEVRALQGTWQLVREIYDGKEVPQPEGKKGTLTFYDGRKWKVEIAGKVVGQGTFTISAKKRPKAIDYTFLEGEAKGTVFSAIYELNG